MTDTAKIIVYEHNDFKGAARELTGDVTNLNDLGFNDRISSIKVIGGVWVGYQHTNYTGVQSILEEGTYANPGEWSGSNDDLSSLRKLSLDIGETPSITVYQHSNYGGRALNFTYAVNNLSYYSFNDAVSSIKVKSGTWILYKDNDFSGRQFVVTEGNYPDPGHWQGSNDEITSMRPVKEPNYPTEVISMNFDISSGLINTKPVALVNLSQSNDTSIDQQASWSTKRSVSTTRTYQWDWNNSTAVSVETTFSTGVPIIAEGKITVGVTNTFSIGESRGEENTQSDEWNFSLPATIKARTRLRAQVNIQQGIIDVPFTAMLQRGNKVWKEIGTYKGTQSYNLQVDFKETPL